MKLGIRIFLISIPCINLNKPVIAVFASQGPVFNIFKRILFEEKIIYRLTTPPPSPPRKKNPKQTDKQKDKDTFFINQNLTALTLFSIVFINMI